MRDARDVDPPEVDLGLLTHDTAAYDVPETGPGKVSRPRNRLVVGGLLAAAAAVVAVLALAPGLGTLPEPPTPVTPSPSPALAVGTVPQEVRNLIADDRTHRIEVAGGLDGSVAVIWRELDGNPRYALVTRTADGTTTGQIIEAPFGLTAVPGGWVAMRSYRAYLLTPEGRLTDLPIQAVIEPRAGDIQVETGERPFLYRPSVGLLAPVAMEEEADATYLNAEGDLVTYNEDKHRISSTAGGGTSVPEDASYVFFAGNADVVVALVQGDQSDGLIVLMDIAISRDGGRSWEHTLPQTPKPVQATSAAVDAEGTVLVATSEDGVFRIPASGAGVSSAGIVLNQVAQAGTTLTYGWDDQKDRAYLHRGTAPTAWKVLSDSFL